MKVRPMILLSFSTLLVGCGAMSDVRSAEQSWEQLVAERGSSYTWTLQAEFNTESYDTIEVEVEDGVAVRRTITMTNLQSDDPVIVREEAIDDFPPSALQTVPDWHQLCRAKLRSAPVTRSADVQLNGLGLISTCTVVWGAQGGSQPTEWLETVEFHNE